MSFIWKGGKNQNGIIQLQKLGEKRVVKAQVDNHQKMIQGEGSFSQQTKTVKRCNKQAY